MDHNSASNPTNTRVQPSIRSFFQPRTPQYSAPPSQPLIPQYSAPSRTPHSSAPPSQAPQTSKPDPPQQNSTNPPVSTPQPTSEPSRQNAPPQQNTQQGLILPIREDHIQPLRRINALLLPIAYPDSFYHKILSTPLSRVILWPSAPTSFTTSSTLPSENKVIGGIVIRLDPAISPSSTPAPQVGKPEYVEGTYDIYIQSLCLLSPYRGKGLASQCLQSVVEGAVKWEGGKVRDLYAHVWTENKEGLEWYEKRGFVREGEVVEGYYRRLEPGGAWVLRRRVGVEEYLSSRSTTLPNEKENKTQQSAPQKGVELGGKEGIGNGNGNGGALKERPSIQQTQSFQDRRPDMEWNDLPEDVLRPNSGAGSLLRPPSETSAASSRSSSRSGAGKKKRVYPAAAFGS